MRYKTILLPTVFASAATAIMAVTAVPATVAAVAPTPQGWRAWAPSSLYLGVAAIVLVVGVACLLLGQRLFRTNDQRASSPPIGKATEAARAELIAQTNGRETVVGRLNEVRRFTIGSGLHAAVPLAGNGIQARHISLQRDGEKFRLRNRSRTPITVNGVSVCGGGRCRVVLPAEIRLNDNTAVSLLIRPKGGALYRDLSLRLRSGLSRLLKLALVMFFIPGAATAAAAATAEVTSQVEPLRLWLTLDTSPSTKGVAGELRTVARAAVRALRPGDRLRVLSAHADRPRLRALERIGPDGPSESELERVLDEVRPAIMLKADLAEALAVPLRAVRERPSLAKRTAVLVLTDGNVDGGRAAEFLDAVDRLESAGACVLCTGTDRSARRLLAAAARGRLRWAGLAEADPAAWISGLRPRPPTPETPRPETPGPDREGEVEDKTPKAQPAPAAEPHDRDEQPPPGGTESAVPERTGPPSSDAQGETPSEPPEPAPSRPEPAVEPPPAPAGPPQPTAVEKPDSAPELPEAAAVPPEEPTEAAPDGIPPSPAEDKAPDSGEASGPAPSVPQAPDTSPDSPRELTDTPPDVSPEPAAGLPEQTAPRGQPPSQQAAAGKTPVRKEERKPKPAAAEPSDDAAPGSEARAGETAPADAAAADAQAAASPEEEPGGSGESDAGDRHTSEPTDGGQDKAAQSIGDDVTGEAEQPKPVEENEPRRPARPVRSTPSEPAERAAGPAQSRSPGRETAQPQRDGPWSILLALGLISGIGLLVWMGVLVVDFVRSRPGKTDTPDTGEEEEPDRRELVAYAGGRKIALGPLAEVRRLDIGSGPGAAVPLTAEGVLPRHATLIRKGEAFRLRNRSRAPLTVNGVTLPARRSARIVLPADVLLDGGTRVAFRVRMNPPEGPQPAVQGAL